MARRPADVPYVRAPRALPWVALVVAWAGSLWSGPAPALWAQSEDPLDQLYPVLVSGLPEPQGEVRCGRPPALEP